MSFNITIHSKAIAAYFDGVAKVEQAKQRPIPQSTNWISSLLSSLIPLVLPLVKDVFLSPNEKSPIKKSPIKKSPIKKNSSSLSMMSNEFFKLGDMFIKHGDLAESKSTADAESSSDYLWEECRKIGDTCFNLTDEMKKKSHD